MSECKRVFERIYTGEIPDAVTFKSTYSEHPVFAVLALKQATRGHTVVTSTECVQNLDLVSHARRRDIDIVSRATGIWLQAAFDPSYVGTLVAGVEVPHAHAHRIPSFASRDWLKVMGADDPKPFPEMSADEKAEVFARAKFAADYAAVVEEALINSEEGLIPVFTEMAYDLRLPL